MNPKYKDTLDLFTALFHEFFVFFTQILPVGNGKPQNKHLMSRGEYLLRLLKEQDNQQQVKTAKNTRKVIIAVVVNKMFVYTGLEIRLKYFESLFPLKDLFLNFVEKVKSRKIC